jgi:hypothetical protein
MLIFRYPMKKKNIYQYIIVVLTLFFSAVSLVNGQPPEPPGNHGLNGNHGPGGAAPVDGGSLLLIFAGLGYGAVKLVRGRGKK